VSIEKNNTDTVLYKDDGKAFIYLLDKQTRIEMFKLKQIDNFPEIRDKLDLAQLIEQSEDVCLCHAATIFGISKPEAKRQIQELILVVLPGFTDRQKV